MAIFIGGKGEEILSWRSVADLVTSMRETLAERMATLPTAGNLELLRELNARLGEELAAEEEFSAALERVLQALEEAVYADEFPTIHSRFKGLVADYFHRTGSVLAIHAIANTFRDALLRKVLSLAERDLAREGSERPAVASCWLAYGSSGRLEQTLCDEHRLLLIHRGEDAASRAYFDTLSQRTMTVLRACFPAAAHHWREAGEMSWTGTVSAFRRFGEEEGEEGPVLEWGDPSDSCGLLADLRAVAGDVTLAGELLALVREMIGRLRQTDRFRQTARRVVSQPTPLGFFGGLKVEKSGPHRGAFNLRLFALAPLIATVRVLAVRHGIPATATVERLKALVEGRHLNVELTEHLLLTYHEFSRWKILLELKHGCREGHCFFLNPAEMGEEEEFRLREGLEAVETLQRIVGQQFEAEG